jgi:hypothetical protein
VLDVSDYFASSPGPTRLTEGISGASLDLRNSPIFWEVIDQHSLLVLGA